MISASVSQFSLMAAALYLRGRVAYFLPESRVTLQAFSCRASYAAWLLPYYIEREITCMVCIGRSFCMWSFLYQLTWGSSFLAYSHASSLTAQSSSGSTLNGLANALGSEVYASSSCLAIVRPRHIKMIKRTLETAIVAIAKMGSMYVTLDGTACSHNFFIMACDQ